MKRIEFRAPDPSCNPYLAFSSIIAAGLDGIKKKISTGDPIDEDIFKMTPIRRRQLGIKQLPTSLLEASEALDSDREFLKPLFDDSVIEKLIEHATNEYREVTLRPHPYEFSLYADV
jgi:glutamine synthetase